MIALLGLEGVGERQIEREREWPWFQNGFPLDVNTYVGVRTYTCINALAQPRNGILIVSGLPCS